MEIEKEYTVLMIKTKVIVLLSKIYAKIIKIHTLIGQYYVKGK